MKKEQFCPYCGDSMGVYDKPHGEIDTCGKIACEREARNDMQAEREEAHRQLDRDRGWD